MRMTSYAWLVPVGFVIGAYGTLIGAGGGFVLVPLLLLVYPTESPEIITSISLAVVFFNALSGSAAYARSGRIDYQSGLLFALATIPGAILGALSTAYVPRRTFDIVLGVLMVAGAAFLLRRPHGGEGYRTREGKLDHGRMVTLTEANGTVHTFSYSPGVGVGWSVVVGYLASLVGIGGGILHVPALVRWLNFPVHVATATSHFVQAIMALTGTLVHILPA